MVVACKATFSVFKFLPTISLNFHWKRDYKYILTNLEPCLKSVVEPYLGNSSRWYLAISVKNSVIDV